MPLDSNELGADVPVRIPARSRRHAMDWSLVLASQGIEALIEHAPEAGWALIVPRADCARAREAIRQYRLENLGWPWRKPVFRRRLVFDSGSSVWVVLAVLFHSLAETRPALHDVGLMDTTRFANGQWWRVFTAMWLHNDAAHLASNVVFGFVLLGL